MWRKTNSRGLIALILGEQPTTDQKTVVRFMLLALLFWPIGSFMSLFFWDAPTKSSIDDFCRYGAAYTIWLYPIYLIPLLRLWFILSKKLGRKSLFNYCPLIPVAVFLLFLTIASSSFAEGKPEGYDPSTYKRLNKTYTLDVNHVYYRFNVSYKILEEADPSTFKVLSDDYAADMHHVWFNGNMIEGAEPATFVVPDGNISAIADALAHDAHDYYLGDLPLHVANMGSFRRIDDNWALDSLQAYYIGIGGNAYNKAVSVGDYRTFKVLNTHYAVDSKCVYYQNGILPGANPKTFVIFPSHDVYDDHVSNNDPDTEYSHDGNHVYYCDSLVSDADIASFICGYDYVAGQAFAFDKNRYYQGTPNPRIEKLRQGKSQVSK